MNLILTPEKEVVAQRPLETDQEKMRELKIRIAHLENEISDKDKQISKYTGLTKVLKNLEEAERTANELERQTGHELAYDLWHGLREATAKMRSIILPALRISVTDRKNGIITTYHVRR